MPTVITPGQARAEALGIEPETGTASLIALLGRTCQDAIRTVQVCRVQASLDAAAGAIAQVAATLIGHSRADLLTFASPRQEVTQAAKIQNQLDAKERAHWERRLEGAVTLARAIVILSHQAALPQRTEVEEVDEQVAEPEVVQPELTFEGAPEAERNEVSA